MYKTGAVRQGDVLVLPLEDGWLRTDGSLDRVPDESGRVVLAHGEHTGHHHSMPALRGAVLFRDVEGSGGTYLVVEEPIALEHQEHSALTLERGVHEVRRQMTAVMTPGGRARISRVID